MDPDAALICIRDAIVASEASSVDEVRIEALRAMVESFTALDGWLCNEGFLPQAWSGTVARDDEMTRLRKDLADCRKGVTRWHEPETLNP